MNYIRFRNWVMTPTLYALLVVLMTKIVGIDMSWKLWVVVVWGGLVQDFIDFVVEDRPVMGPYRWKQRPPSTEE